MKPDITVSVILIELILLIPYSFEDATLESFDDILQNYEPSITLPKPIEESLRKLPRTEWKSVIKYNKDLQKENAILQKENAILQKENAIFKLKSPYLDFHCAVKKAKNLFQFFKIQMNGCKTDYRLEIPDIFAILIAEQSRYDGAYTNTEKFEKIISKWHYFIDDARNPYAKCVKENLELYLKHHKDAYSDMDKLYPVFYASVARSSFLFNYLHHIFLTVAGHQELPDDKNIFFTFLRQHAPFYYLDKTDVDFINILIISQNLKKPIKQKKLFKYFKTNFRPSCFENYPVYENFEAILPQSDDCMTMEVVDSMYDVLPFTTASPNVRK